jgi:tetratricopeptide (TPR) repeat protein
VYHLESRYVAAEPLYRRALAIHEKSNTQDAETTLILIGLAELYRVQGRNSEAEAIYERVIPMQESTLGPDHWHLARSLYNLAEMYRQDARYSKAEPLYRRSLAILEKEPAEQRPALVRGLKTFAAMLRRMKRKPEALALEAKAQAILHSEALTASNAH